MCQDFRSRTKGGTKCAVTTSGRQLVAIYSGIPLVCRQLATICNGITLVCSQLTATCYATGCFQTCAFIALNDDRRVLFFFLQIDHKTNTFHVITFSTIMFSPKEFDGFSLKIAFYKFYQYFYLSFNA